MEHLPCNITAPVRNRPVRENTRITIAVSPGRPRFARYAAQATTVMLGSTRKIRQRHIMAAFPFWGCYQYYFSASDNVCRRATPSEKYMFSSIYEKHRFGPHVVALRGMDTLSR